jgi:ubiquitin carboxyl-terminal hydrolase 25/28
MAFAYLSQQRCDPEKTPEYFEILQSYVNSAQLIGHEVPEWFQKMILNERERGRYTPEDFAYACKTFGFGPDGSLGVELNDADLPFLMLAFRHALENSGVLQRELTDQFRVLLRARGVRAFMDAFNKHVETGLMTVDDAYRLLQATADVDEGMLIITADMNASDSPSQADKIRDAISLIAEARNSHRLRKFLEIGVDRTSSAVRYDDELTML